MGNVTPKTGDRARRFPSVPFGPGAARLHWSWSGRRRRMAVTRLPPGS